MPIERVALKDLQLDFTVYPRPGIDSQHVSRMVESLRAGATLPPPWADRRTLRVSDGFHRITALRRVESDVAEIDVDLRDYADEAEFLLDAARQNAIHGKSLTTFDMTSLLLRLHSLGVTPEASADALSITVEKVHHLVTTRVATTPDGQTVPLRRGALGVAQTVLTPRQVNSARHASGMNLQFHVRTIENAVTGDLVNLNDETLVRALAALGHLLVDTFDTQPANA